MDADGSKQMHQIEFITTELDEAGNLRPFTRTEHTTSVLDLFFGPLGPYMFGVMPPRAYLNEFFRVGSIDGKYDGKHVLFEWKPFELSEDDYSYLLSEALRLPGRPFAVVDIPSDVRTRAEFEHWVFVRALNRRKPKDPDST